MGRNGLYWALNFVVIELQAWAQLKMKKFEAQKLRSLEASRSLSTLLLYVPVSSRKAVTHNPKSLLQQVTTRKGVCSLLCSYFRVLHFPFFFPEQYEVSSSSSAFALSCRPRYISCHCFPSFIFNIYIIFLISFSLCRLVRLAL